MPLEIFTLKRERTDIRHKDILSPVHVDKLVVTPYYNLDGSQIIDHKGHPIETFEKCIAVVMEESWTEFGKRWKEWYLIINGERYKGGNVTEIEGNKKQLNIKVCWGEG